MQTEQNYSYQRLSRKPLRPRRKPKPYGATGVMPKPKPKPMRAEDRVINSSNHGASGLKRTGNNTYTDSAGQAYHRSGRGKMSVFVGGVSKGDQTKLDKKRRNAKMKVDFKQTRRYNRASY